jgi:hypothetical protein
MEKPDMHTVRMAVAILAVASPTTTLRAAVSCSMTARSSSSAQKRSLPSFDGSRNGRENDETAQFVTPSGVEGSGRETDEREFRDRMPPLQLALRASGRHDSGGKGPCMGDYRTCRGGDRKCGKLGKRVLTRSGGFLYNKKIMRQITVSFFGYWWRPEEIAPTGER